MSDDSLAPTPRGSTPVPDPTQLTDAAIAKLKSLLEDKIEAEVRILNTRLGGIETLTDERFEAAEKLRIEQKKDTKDAVDAALSAAKEAVKEQTTASERSIDKSETATREALKQMAETFAKTTEGLSDKIDDLKERINRVDSIKQGATEQRQIGTDNRQAIYATVALVVSLILVTIAVIGFILAQTRVP